MAYRSDLDAMTARLANLDAEVAEKTQERDEVARLLAEARQQERREAILADIAAGGPERRLRRNALLALGAVSATALGVLAYREVTKPDKLERAMAVFETFADKMCACKDKACADKVNDEMTRWAAAMAKELDDPKPTEPQLKRAAAVGQKLGDCMGKLMNATPERPE